jgi:hypothetical protein
LAGVECWALLPAIIAIGEGYQGARLQQTVALFDEISGVQDNNLGVQAFNPV